MVSMSQLFSIKTIFFFTGEVLASISPIENFFGHVKNPSFDETCQLVNDYIYFFNFEKK